MKIGTELGVVESTPTLELSLAADGERNNSFSFRESRVKTESNQHVRGRPF